jgi:hypothetical protein
MIFTKRILAAASVVALTGLGLVATAVPASAYVVCNRAGDCWHTEKRYHYGPEIGATYHNDDWYFHQHWDDTHHYRDYHEGRGGYRNGVWFSF